MSSIENSPSRCLQFRQLLLQLRCSTTNLSQSSCIVVWHCFNLSPMTWWYARQMLFSGWPFGKTCCFRCCVCSKFHYKITLIGSLWYISILAILSIVNLEGVWSEGFDPSQNWGRGQYSVLGKLCLAFRSCISLLMVVITSCKFVDEIVSQVIHLLCF